MENIPTNQPENYSGNYNIISTSPKTNPLIIVILVFLLLLISAGSFVLGKYFTSLQEQPKITQTLKPNIVITPSPITDPTADWKTYTNNKYSFSFKYPPDSRILGDMQSTTFTMLINNNPITVLISDNTLKEDTENHFLTIIGGKDHALFKDKVKFSKIVIGNNQFVLAEQDSTYFSLQPGGFQNLIASGSDYIVIFKYSNQGRQLLDQILSTFRFLEENTTPITPTVKANYFVPSDWKKTILKNGLTLCLPPKWEYNGFADLEFNRDPGYKPTITTITEIPYAGGSKREAYFSFWKNEYPDVSSLVSVEETDINGNPVLTIYPKYNAEVKQTPEGLTVVWFASEKLWKAGLSSWSYVNPSQKEFLNDFYKVISCSF